METELILLVVLSPFTLWGMVTAGVTGTAWLANRWGRRDPMDTWQERAFLRRRVTLAQRMHGLGVEGFWQTVAFGLQGVHMVRRFKNPPLEQGGGQPVILVAGYMENGGQMWPLARRLRQRGYQAVVFDLPSTLRGIADNAAALRDEIERVRDAAGADHVALVGHSMGGVIMRACAHREDAPPISTIISVASPHRGTHLAKLGPGQSAKDMRPGSPHVRSHPHSRRSKVKIHTLVSLQDNIVSPAWSAILCEGENVVLQEPVGHVAPLFMPGVAAQIAEWIEAAQPAPVEAGAA